MSCLGACHLPPVFAVGILWPRGTGWLSELLGSYSSGVWELMHLRVSLGPWERRVRDTYFPFSPPARHFQRHISEGFAEDPQGSDITVPMVGATLIAHLCIGCPPSLSPPPSPSLLPQIPICQRNCLHTKFVSRCLLRKPVLRYVSVHRPHPPSAVVYHFRLNSVWLLLGHY